MRRRIKKNNLIFIALTFIAMFTALSFIFDQRVVQQENMIRQTQAELSGLRIKMQDEMFIQNSLIQISKEIKFSIKMQQNILDDLYVTRPWFEDHLEYSLPNSDGERYTSLRGGKIAFKKLLDIYKKNFINVFIQYNETIKDFNKVMATYNNNETFGVLSSAYDLDIANIDILKDYLITDEEIQVIPIDYIEDISVRGSNESPIYKLYSKYRNRMHKFSEIALYTLEIASDFSILQTKNYKEYEASLLEFTKIKNNKNMFILLSIFFQILSLTSIMILFKIVVNIEKK